MVALLALRPLRLRNFTAIEIGRHLVRQHDGGLGFAQNLAWPDQQRGQQMFA